MPVKKVLEPLYYWGCKPVTRVVWSYRTIRRPAFSKPGAPPKCFAFNGQEYRYFFHPYNMTWRNERAVEIPIVWRMVQEFDGKNILEVGNVFSHYFHVTHDIVDKYEKAPGVINEDILDYRTPRRYDLIVCISTLEHVGFEELTRDADKALPAFENLVEMLVPGGTIVVTLPVHLNTDIVRFAVDGVLPFTELYAFRRGSKENEWVEVDPKIARDVPINDPFPVNAFLIGFYKN